MTRFVFCLYNQLCLPRLQIVSSSLMTAAFKSHWVFLYTDPEVGNDSGVFAVCVWSCLAWQPGALCTAVTRKDTFGNGVI
jgi:hypothetical protein